MKYLIGILALLFIIILIPIIILIFNLFDLRDVTLNAINPIDGISIDSDINIKQDVDSNPLLNETQEAILESIGIDPATLPTEITPQMQECAIEALGLDRIKEILAESAPTLNDIVAIQECI